MCVTILLSHVSILFFLVYQFSEPFAGVCSSPDVVDFKPIAHRTCYCSKGSSSVYSPWKPVGQGRGTGQASSKSRVDSGFFAECSSWDFTPNWRPSWGYSMLCICRKSKWSFQGNVEKVVDMFLEKSLSLNASCLPQYCDEIFFFLP